MSKEKQLLSSLTREATYNITTFNDTDNTIDVTASTGMAGRRYDWWKERSYMESLDMDASSIRLDRFLNGAPVIDNHSRYGSLASNTTPIQVGVITRAWLENGQLRATIKLSNRPELKGFVQDVKDGIIRNLSIGYNVYEYTVDESGDIPEYRATDWEPTELSFVTVPFDWKSQTRSAEGEPQHEVKFVYKYQRNNTDTMKTENQEQGKSTNTPAADGTTVVVDAAAERAAGAAAERQRCNEITDLCRMSGVDAAFGDNLIRQGTSFDQARALIQAEWARNQDQKTIQSSHTARVTGGDEVEQDRAAMQEALLHRISPGANKLTSERAKDYTHLTLLEMGRAALELKGENTKRMSRSELAERALSSSDFPIVLSNIAKMTLRRSYETQDSTWRAIASRVDMSDFKPVSGAQFGGSTDFEEIKEGAEYTFTKLKESKDTIQLRTYGKGIGMTRTMLINDDLNAFSRVATIFGASAANKESALMWGLIKGNPVLGDGKALFHSEHKNLAAVGSALSVESLSAARLAMRRQVGLDKELIKVSAKYLIVPPELETDAEKILSAVVATAQGDVNPFAGKLQVLVVPELEDAKAWYLSGDVNAIDVLQYGYLNGNEGLYTESKLGFKTDGVEIKARIDFAHGVWEYRGLYKNPGA